ncbi:hypothetical protein CAP2UW1_4543 (plasmid) [Candidatus Accumulibacter phosphatis clade IIA str. UW-1]|uniref:Uncharacterized protein n=1 Tax=Accumulibacter regalis TaxID=522306 RepID=C7RW65_ACCRE
MTMVVRMPMIVMSGQSAVSMRLIVAACVVNMRNFHGARGHGVVQLLVYCPFHTLKLL